MSAELAPFLLLGLAGSFHCAGMCGGFALCATARSAGRGTAAVLLDTLAFTVGKAATYAILGASLGLGLSALPIEHPQLELLRRLVAGLAALVLLVAGLGLIGLQVGSRRWVPVRLTAGLGRLLAGARSLPGRAGSFGTGVLTGLLPCGLSWSAFLLAAASEPAVAVAGPFVFGLATGPSLAAVAVLGRAASTVRAGRWARALAGPALIAIAAVTALRAMPGTPAPCCADGDAAQTTDA